MGELCEDEPDWMVAADVFKDNTASNKIYSLRNMKILSIQIISFSKMSHLLGKIMNLKISVSIKIMMITKEIQNGWKKTISMVRQ